MEQLRKIVYMSYLSHIEFRMYENLALSEEDPLRFRVELSISPDFSKNQPIEEVSFGKGFTMDQIRKFMETVLKPMKPEH